MRWVAIAVAGLVLVAACGPSGGTTSPSGGTPKAGGTATIALESELRTLDPLDSSLLVEREVFYNLYDSLFTIDPSLKITPGLVKSWDVSDPMNFKFTLQSGVKYQDGTAFNAQSVKDNIQRYLTASTSRRKSDLASVSSVEVVDDSHVIFHLKKPDATLLATLVDRAGMMLSMAAVQKGGQNFSLAPVGASEKFWPPFCTAAIDSIIPARSTSVARRVASGFFRWKMTCESSTTSTLLTLARSDLRREVEAVR